MANITINEVSQNYTYNIGNSSYATVAMPITAAWGPGFEYGTQTNLILDDESLESSVWARFAATQEGLENFVSTYRGPATQYLSRKDFSYQMAMTLLTSGYDILVCRVAGGVKAFGSLFFGNPNDNQYVEFPIKAKYAGTFGNSLQVTLKKVTKTTVTYWNLVVYMIDSAGVRTAVENLNFVFDLDKATDSILHISEIESNYITFAVSSAPTSDTVELYEGELPEGSNIIYDEINRTMAVRLASGTDHPALSEQLKKEYDTAEAAYTQALQVYNSALTAKNEAQANVDATTADIATQQAILDDSAATEEAKAAAEAEISRLQELLSAQQTALTEAESALASAEAAQAAAQAVRDEAKAAWEAVVPAHLEAAYQCALARYNYSETGSTQGDSAVNSNYLLTLNGIKEEASVDVNTAMIIAQREWVFNAAYSVLGALTDKLAYNPNRIIVPGWDDQDISFLLGTDCADQSIDRVSPLHQRLMDIAYYSRCATAYLDVPRSLKRSEVYDDTNAANPGYAQKLSELQYKNLTVNGELYSSHAALFAPWGKYMYVGTGKQLQASPSFLALMIDRAMIKNQTSQYEWELPTNRKHNLRLGKLDYPISKKYLDLWQSNEGVGVNCITNIPDIGVSIWGNSTLYDVPPATYQALANLSTRKLVNAVEDLAYRCGIAITFQYNNAQAYNSFYAGMVPLLDTMRNVGAISDYYIRMASDIDQLGQVMANSVVGKIYLVIEGVINDITVDLIALPPATDLDQFKA